jgi:hypothetical protein
MAIKYSINLEKSGSAMETKYVLPQKYSDLGFNLSKFGKESLALSYQGKTVFVFSSTIDVRNEFVSRLCDCRLKLNSYAKVPARN